MSDSTTQFNRKGRDGEQLELTIDSDGNSEIAWLPPGADETDDEAWTTVVLPRHASQWLIGMCMKAHKMFKPAETKPLGGK